MRLAIIQARMTSSRLPGKVLMPLHGVRSLERMLARVSQARRLDKIVVATTVNSTDDPVVKLCEDLGVTVFRGDEHDVLGRFLEAATAFKGTTIIRLTADCPMLDPAVLDQVIAGFEDGDWDYYSNTRTRTFPDGLDCEVFTFDALEKAAKNAAPGPEREHVTPYICGENGFKMGQLTFPADFSHVRWTLDTAHDFDIISELLSRLPDDYHWQEALAEATRKPCLLGLPEDLLQARVEKQPCPS